MKTEKFSGIALAILALLYEEPMHPYRMQQLIKERGKDDYCFEVKSLGEKEYPTTTSLSQ